MFCVRQGLGKKARLKNQTEVGGQSEQGRAWRGVGIEHTDGFVSGKRAALGTRGRVQTETICSGRSVPAQPVF